MSKKSRELRDRIKENDDRAYSSKLRSMLSSSSPPANFRSFSARTCADTRTRPRTVGARRRRHGGTHCNRAREARLGTVSPVLKRTRRVTKSAWTRGADRPRALEHFDTISMEQSLIKPERIVFIDDFVTRGATFWCAFAQSEIAAADIKAFALVRSITDGEIEAIREPVTGTIDLDSDGESWRRP